MEYLWDEQEASAIVDEVDLLAYLSNLVGRDPTLTQPGGGNSSLKRRETDFAGRPVSVLRVKGSGTDLASIRRSGFTGLRLDELGLLRGQRRLSDEELVAFLRGTMVDGTRGRALHRNTASFRCFPSGSSCTPTTSRPRP